MACRIPPFEGYLVAAEWAGAVVAPLYDSLTPEETAPPRRQPSRELPERDALRRGVRIGRRAWHAGASQAKRAFRAQVCRGGEVRRATAVRVRVPARQPRSRAARRGRGDADRRLSGRPHPAPRVHPRRTGRCARAVHRSRPHGIEPRLSRLPRRRGDPESAGRRDARPARGLPHHGGRSRARHLGARWRGCALAHRRLRSRLDRVSDRRTPPVRRAGQILDRRGGRPTARGALSPTTSFESCRTIVSCATSAGTPPNPSSPASARASSSNRCRAATRKPHGRARAENSRPTSRTDGSASGCPTTGRARRVRRTRSTPRFCRHGSSGRCSASSIPATTIASATSPERGGLEQLARACREGWHAAFALYPTSMDELVAVADAGQVMPPKSTWFDPKPRSGFFFHDPLRLCES